MEVMVLIGRHFYFGNGGVLNSVCDGLNPILRTLMGGGRSLTTRLRAFVDLSGLIGAEELHLDLETTT
jgi:hypothetical protein